MVFVEDAAPLKLATTPKVAEWPVLGSKTEQGPSTIPTIAEPHGLRSGWRKSCKGPTNSPKLIVNMCNFADKPADIT